MGDILVSGIWNRILISTFGIAATPVGLLIALRYLLSPLSLWAGYRSDTRTLWGSRRTAYIWLGRGLMLASLPLLGASVGRLEADTASLSGWFLATLSFLLYGIGTLMSGSPFLALVRDSAPKERQGLAIGLAETALIIFFAIVGIVFSFWMQEYDQGTFRQMVLATMVVGGFFWFFAIAGVEKQIRASETPLLPGLALLKPDVVGAPNFWATFGRIWADGRTRRFFIFLALAGLAAWMQDAILEPFGAEALGLSIGDTTRFNSYWQGATVLTLVGSAIAWRRRPPERQTAVARGGLLLMILGMLLLTVSALAAQVTLTRIALVVFGGGFGIYTFGGLSLMAVMSSDQEAGAYLGLWTVAILLFKGLGTALGGILRDLLLSIGLSAGASYGTIFALEAAGLLAAVLLLTSVDILSFARDTGRIPTSWETAAAALD